MPMLPIVVVFSLVTAPFSLAQDQCTTSIAAYKAMTSCRGSVEGVVAAVTSSASPDAGQLATACSAECATLWRTAIRDCEPVSQQIATESRNVGGLDGRGRAWLMLAANMATLLAVLTLGFVLCFD